MIPLFKKKNTICFETTEGWAPYQSNELTMLQVKSQDL